MIVFDDADPEEVAEGIKIAGYWNSGQDCTAGTRIIAGPKIYDSLLEALVPAIESLKVGDPADGDDVEMGPLISQRPAGARARLPRSREGRDRAHRRGVGQREGLLREADDRHRCGPGRRDRPERGVRPGRDRAALRRRRRGDRVGERNPLRPRRLGVDARHRPRTECGPQAPVWDRLDQRPSRADRLGDAARRLQAVRATARTCRRTRWRSTRRSSTSSRSSVKEPRARPARPAIGSQSPAAAFARTCSGFVAPAITDATGLRASRPPIARSSSECAVRLSPRAQLLDAIELRVVELAAVQARALGGRALARDLARQQAAREREVRDEAEAEPPARRQQLRLGRGASHEYSLCSDTYGSPIAAESRAARSTCAARSSTCRTRAPCPRATSSSSAPNVSSSGVPGPRCGAGRGRRGRSAGARATPSIAARM